MKHDEEPYDMLLVLWRVTLDDAKCCGISALPRAHQAPLLCQRY